MILVISDYHKEEDRVIDLIRKYKPEYTLCLGDGQSCDSFYEENNIISVRGNCDFANLPLVKILEIENKRILMVHGHNHNVHFSMFKLFLFGKENNCDLVLFGHTHKQFIEKCDNITFLNPGALNEGNYAIIDKEEIILK